MSHSAPTEKTNIPSSSALWAVLIFIGLILAAVNFVKAESTGEGHGEAATEHTEATPAHEGEHGTPAIEAEKPAQTTDAAAAPVTPVATDTAKTNTTEEAHH